MVIDTSAILAVLFGEPEAAPFSHSIGDADTRLVSTVSALEAAIVIGTRKGAIGVRELDLFLHTISADLVPFNEDHLMLAREAYDRYGKGRHAAGLNFGDCCTYGLARHSGEPLLFKGRDFALTDIPTA